MEFADKAGLCYRGSSWSIGQAQNGTNINAGTITHLRCILSPFHNRFELRFYMIAKGGEVGKSLRNGKRASFPITKASLFWYESPLNFIHRASF